MSRFFAEAEDELERAQNAFSSFASAHEGAEVLREEFEELIAWVRKKPADRSSSAMRRECIQIAAMAARFAVELCDTGKVNAR